MKIEQLLVQHFYNAREVTLQGMGTFTLSPDFVMPSENDKDSTVPDNAISFHYNSRAAEDDALISYIVQQTRKMRPLASADLDSYLVLGKQFLNIGKPFKIEGLGLLVKNQQGEYQFTQGHTLHSKPEEVPPTVLREKFEEDDISFASESGRTAIGSKGLKIAALVIGIGLIGATAWYFLRQKTDTPVQTAEVQPVAKPDTAQKAQVVPDPVAVVRKDSAAIPVTTGGSTFKVVFRILSKGGALKKKIELNKPNVVMYTTDSVHYKLAEVFSRPLADTTRVKDSLRIFYAFRTFIELK